MIYLVLAVPAAVELSLFAFGWAVAHWIIGIQNPGGVQHGEHPVLDALGTLARLMLLPTLGSFVALVLLPIVLILRWHSAMDRKRSSWLTAWLLVLLAVPPVIFFLMARPFGGPPWGIGDWMPD